MIYRIGSQKLNVPETGTPRKIRTPRQVVPWRDVAETCRTLDAICSEIPNKKKFDIVDGIARAGFWGAVFRDRWPDCKLTLNEEKETCTEVLKQNFPDDKILCKSIHKWAPKKCDISLLDFDHFTLNILDRWREVLKQWCAVSHYFIIADGACFGFKFGNLRHYGISDEKDYYYLLNDALKDFLGKRITVVSRFLNASTILLEDCKGKDIKFLPPSSMLLFRGGKQYKKAVKSPGRGFGLCDGR